MTDDLIEETMAFWDRVASDWDIQVGEEGDRNRRLNSDPVLWQFAGDVAGLDVLDAGCGTGYLSRILSQRGARVIGVDFSPRMIEVARGKSSDIDYRIDSCCELKTVDSGSVDLVVSNYVLMDLPDLSSAVAAFSRVLKPGGIAVVVFSHPCFPAGRANSKDGVIEYQWEFPYFEPRKFVDPPWAHFTSEFIWFHRPLSDYWKAFKSADFDVVDFEEPRLTEERHHLAPDAKTLLNAASRPFSVAFKLRKAAHV
jgi:SAM-dependent methyltransferase